METQRLRGEVAIVTGSDSGIGQATAKAFAREGADVAITYFHDREGAEATLRAVLGLGGQAYVFQLDQRDPERVRSFFDEAERLLGTPTLLLNGAGVDSSGEYVKDMSPEEWDKEIRSNLYGPFYCCREFIRRLEGKGKHGTILNVTSVHQEIPRAGAAGYCASKGGLRNLTTCLALELAEKNINVNNIAPGMVLTPMNQQAVDDPEFLKREVVSIPMKRAAEPEEIAEVAVFLTSKEARYIHGETVTVDGALSLFQGQGA
jgi:glucose 1-dehydrogenase